MPRLLEEMSALPVLASFFALIALAGLGLAQASLRVGRLSEGGQVALDAVRKTAAGQLFASLKLQLGALLLVAGLAALGGILRGNGWFLPFLIVPLCAVGALFMAWIGANAGLLEVGTQLAEVKVPGGGVHRLARRVLGATLFAQATGALVGLGLGYLDSAYGLRLAPWAATGVALTAVFVALAAATLEPLTLEKNREKAPSPTNLGAAAALSLLRPMRSLLLLAGITLIASDKFARGITSTDPTESEAATFLLLVLGGSALATLMGGLAVRPSEQEENAAAFRRGTWTALLILIACVALGRGHDAAPHRTLTQLWSLGLSCAFVLAFFVPGLWARRSAPRRAWSPRRALFTSARAPFLAAAGLLTVRLFEPNLNAAALLLALSVALVPVALLSSLAADYRRGATHLAWLTLHPNLAEAALRDDSLEHQPLTELGILGLFLLSMEGPSYDLSQLSPLLLGPLVLLGGLGIAAALASHRRTLEEPMRQSELLAAAGGGLGSPLTRSVELGERVVPGAGRPLLLFLGIATAIGLLGQTSFVSQAILTPLLLGLWLGAQLLGVGLSSFLSNEPTSTRFSVGPLAFTLSFSLGTLLGGLQTIVL